MIKIVVLGLLLLCLGTEAQEKEYVNAFKNKQLINAQTTVIPQGFDFTIMHRFGKIGLDDRVYKDFWVLIVPQTYAFIVLQVKRQILCRVGKNQNWQNH